MKLRFLLPISLLALIFLGIHSCQKDLEKMSESAAPQNEGVLSRQDSSPTPQLDLQAFDDKVIADYEFPGRTMFEHLYYFQVTRSLADYMPASVYQASAQQRAEVEAFGAGMETYEDMLAYTLDYDYSAKFSVQETASLLSSVNHLDDHIQALITKTDAGDFQSFGQIWYYLKAQETTILQNALLSQRDKNLLLLYNSLLRNYLKYEYGRGEFTSEERGGVVCILGIKLKCWLKVIGLSALKSIITGGAGVAVWVLTIIQQILNLNDEKCKCGDTPPPELPPCKRPDVINVDLEGCGLTQKVVTWGYGTYSGKFVWQLNGGVAPDHNNATVVETDEPWLRVTQTNASQDVFVSVNLKSCNEPDGGSPRQEFFNFYELTAIDLGTMQVWSAAPQTNTDHTVNINSHHQYYIVGTALSKVNDGLATLSFQPTWQGEIESNPALPIGTIQVWWKVYTYGGVQNPIYDARVTATVTPICATSPPFLDDILVAVYLQY